MTCKAYTLYILRVLSLMVCIQLDVKSLKFICNVMVVFVPKIMTRKEICLGNELVLEFTLIGLLIFTRYIKYYGHAMNVAMINAC